MPALVGFQPYLAIEARNMSGKLARSPSLRPGSLAGRLRSAGQRGGQVIVEVKQGKSGKGRACPDQRFA
jgi:hypothetical protein